MKPRPDDWSLGLDSFLDIVTNVIGFLVLVALLAAVGSQHMSVSLDPPILRQPPAGTSRVLFECRDSRVVRVDEANINQSIKEQIQQRRPQSGAKITAADVSAILHEADAGDQYYRVRAEVGNDGELVRIFEPRSSRQGETLEGLDRPSSQFSSLVRGLDPKKKYAFFIVRPDSFEVFRRARKIARDHGLAVGWDPLESNVPMRFSKSGKSGIGTQN